MHDEPVVGIRAFRGSRTSAVYREHVLAESSFERILDVAEQQGLPALAELEAMTEVDKRQARRLADEVTEIRVGAALPDLDEELAALAELARWCGRSRQDAWLTVWYEKAS